MLNIEESEEAKRPHKKAHTTSGRLQTRIRAIHRKASRKMKMTRGQRTVGLLISLGMVFSPAIVALFRIATTHQVAIWLNRIGLVLAFLSFWFAAPEFLGEERLKAWETSMSKFVKPMPKIFTWLLFIVLTYPIVLVFCIFYSLFTNKDLLAFDTHGYALRIVKPLAFFAISCYLLIRITAWISSKVIPAIANSSSQRRLSLYIGAILFIISFLLQFIATFDTTN